MSSIYTKNGDNGTSPLYGSGVGVLKDSIVFEVLGNLDELNAVLGFLHTCRVKEIVNLVHDIQFDLLSLGSVIAGSKNTYSKKEYWVKRTGILENKIDAFDSKNSPLKNFIAPGGSSVSAQLHLARVVCRRAERSFVRYLKENKGSDFLLPYINRLSDLLFVLARYANLKLGVKDTVWFGPKSEF